MRNCPPGTSTIPFVAVFTTYAPLATTSPKDPFCHVYYILPGLAHSGGGMDPRRTKHCQRVPTSACARAQRDSSSDSNAVTSAGIHRAPFTPPQAPERPYDVLAGFSQSAVGGSELDSLTMRAGSSQSLFWSWSGPTSPAEASRAPGSQRSDSELPCGNRCASY
jgi:hypothetical protein